MENLFIPKYLQGSGEEFALNINKIKSDTASFLAECRASKDEECEMLDLMIDNAKQCTAEMIQLQMEKNKVQELKQSLIQEATELELTVKDCQEEIEIEKKDVENLEEQIQKKSDLLIQINQEIKSEETRIENIKSTVRSEYNYYKRCVKQYSSLFNCNLTLAEKESNIYRLVLKDDEQKERVSMNFRTSEQFPSNTNLEVLDIHVKSEPMDSELLKHIQEMMQESQDTQGLLSFLHENYVKK